MRYSLQEEVKLKTNMKYFTSCLCYVLTPINKILINLFTFTINCQ